MYLLFQKRVGKEMRKVGVVLAILETKNTAGVMAAGPNRKLPLVAVRPMAKRQHGSPPGETLFAATV